MYFENLPREKWNTLLYIIPVNEYRWPLSPTNFREAAGMSQEGQLVLIFFHPWATMCLIFHQGKIEERFVNCNGMCEVLIWK